MQLESILIMGGVRGVYHKLRSELRGSCYRLLRARNDGVAKWLIDRVKIGLLLVVQDAVADSVAAEAEHDLDFSSQSPLVSAAGAARPTLLISRNEAVSSGSLLSESGGVKSRSANDSRRVLPNFLSRIPVLHIIADHGAGYGESPQRTLAGAINQGADYVLLAPYEQTELIQAIRTCMLNGPASDESHWLAAPVEIAMQDRICSLMTSRQQMARLFIGAIEQLQHARARVSWCDSEIRGLRQARVRQEMEWQFQSHGLPAVVQGVAHDFANLLESAGAAATALYGTAASPAYYRDAMGGVLEQAQELIECLQDLTQPGNSNWRTEPVDLDAIVAAALKSALVPLRDSRIRVRVRMGGLEPVWAHRSLVYRALVNLIWNAVQAMPNGGLLSILGNVRGNRVVLEVGDTGVGIGAQDRKKILQQPFTTKAGHQGQGLTLVRDLIEKCGGEITFASRPRRGSLFSIALPVAQTSRAGNRSDRDAENQTPEQTGRPSPQVLGRENSIPSTAPRSVRLKRQSLGTPQLRVVLQN